MANEYCDRKIPLSDREAEIPRKKKREPKSVIGNSTDRRVMICGIRVEEEAVRIISST